MALVVESCPHLIVGAFTGADDTKPSLLVYKYLLSSMQFVASSKSAWGTRKPWIPFITFVLLVLSSTHSAFSSDEQGNYIIHVAEAEKPAIFVAHHHWYASILRSLPPSAQSPRIIYTYSYAINGFSARLTSSQAAKLRHIPGILSVLPDRIQQLHITHTPTFLGLNDKFGLWPDADYASDIVIALLDTGIWPERRSFSDSGLSPVPSGWKGICQTGPDFPASACNRKIIGARAYYSGYQAHLEGPMNETAESRSPRDTQGHGTHTSSTAAGASVSNAGFYKYAVGEARGMATKARIAVYKICWRLGCFNTDILAAMDQAVADSVHVISLSVGASFAQDYDRDPIAIGAFGAVQKGILVSCSAGNSGPSPSSAVNIAPWIMTVGASTIDREFPADVILGDGSVLDGASLYTGDPLGASQFPLVYAGDAGDRLCFSGFLDSSKVAGKIVVCDWGYIAGVQKGIAVKNAGGVGMILDNTALRGEVLTAEAHLVPATSVGQIAGNQIREYMKSNPSPTATIDFRWTVIGPSLSAPKVAYFSSRGPSRLTAEILKPDVIAPGVSIVAAWTGATGPTGSETDPRRVEFNIISGTSMSCPHVSGLAALLRKAFPDWSPAALKSALMTTAYNRDNSGKIIGDQNTGQESTPFVYGAGHVDPNRALDPGLVYDISTNDYVAFLCSIGYDPRRIAVIVRTTVDCASMRLDGPGNLNYPSFSVVFKSTSDTVKYKRVVKNVGSCFDAVYGVKVKSPPNVKINVSPRQLVFSSQNRSLSYEITFTSVVANQTGPVQSSFGSIEWSDGKHFVTSPIAFGWSLNLVSSM